MMMMMMMDKACNVRNSNTYRQQQLFHSRNIFATLSCVILTFSVPTLRIASTNPASHHRIGQGAHIHTRTHARTHTHANTHTSWTGNNCAMLVRIMPY